MASSRVGPVNAMSTTFPSSILIPGRSRERAVTGSRLRELVEGEEKGLPVL